MTIEKIALQTMNYYAPAFEVEIEGEKLAAEMSKAILSVTVEEKMDALAGFSITISDGFDMKTQTFKWLDHPLFHKDNKEESKITIRMGYSDNLSEMFRGKITGIESSFFSGEPPTVTIKGEDLSIHEMTAPTPEKAFIDMKYSDVVKTIASAIGLNAVVDETGKYEPVLRKTNEESYLAFIKKLGDRVGYEFMVDGRTLYFVKPGDDKKELLTLKLGKDIISFNPILNTTTRVAAVEVRGHNPKDPSKPFIGKEGDDGEGDLKSGKKVITNVIVTSEEQAKKVARAELDRANNDQVKGDGECIGLPMLRKGVNILLEGMGKRFSGSYYVKKTTHTINNSGYKTRFTVKKNV